MLHVRLRHHYVAGWRRVRIDVGPEPGRLSLRGVLTLRDNHNIDEWSPIRDALFASKALLVEDVEEMK